MKRIKQPKPSSSQHSDGNSIIPRLPDEVALCILARLPRALQVRRLLCHSWKDAMEPARMTSLRKTLNISEGWPIFVSTHAYLYKNSQFLFTIVDPLCRRRRNISLPPQFHCHYRHGASCSFTLNFTVIGAVGTKVLIAATASPMSASDAEWLQLQGVYSFDGLSMKWEDSVYSSLPTNFTIDLHYNFASALDMDGGYLYVAGVYGKHGGLQGVERLDIKTRVWEVLSDPHVKRAHAAGVVLQGLFYLIGGVYERFPDDLSICAVLYSGEIWDPKSKKWTLLPELWPFEVFGKVFNESRVVVLMDRLYALRRTAMVEELMYYEVSSMLWLSMGNVPLNNKYELSIVCLLAMDQELWVVNCDNKACVATKPAFPQPPSWRVLRPTSKRCLPIPWCKMVGVLQV